MAGAILALSAAFAVTVTVQTGNALLGAALFPVGFCLLYLLGFDILTGVFTLVPLALIDKRRGVTVRGMLRNWGLVFAGNLVGGFTFVGLTIYATHVRTAPKRVPKNNAPTSARLAPTPHAEHAPTRETVPEPTPVSAS